jgi:hypothetical protein
MLSLTTQVQGRRAGAEPGDEKSWTARRPLQAFVRLPGTAVTMN